MPSKSKNPVSIGDVFGRLTVVEKIIRQIKSNRSPKGYELQSASKCICNCGNFSIASDKNLKCGDKLSCGCMHKENSSKRIKKISITHDKSKTYIYKIWMNIKTRCYNKNRKSYKNYGGRGIIMCEKWQKFEGFYEDMHAEYRIGLSIERIDNNGNYCKENCKWIHKNEQAKNTRQVNEYYYENKWWLMPDLKQYLNKSRDKIRALNLPKRKLYEDG